MASGDVVFESTGLDVFSFMKNTGSTPQKWELELRNVAGAEKFVLEGDDNLPTATATKQYKITITEV
jgi:hypothetical protein